MASVLRSPALRTDAVLAAPQPLLLDPDWARILDEAREDGYREGHDAGFAAGEARALEQTREVGESLSSAVADVHDRLEEARDEWASRLLHSTVDLVEQLVGSMTADPDRLVSRLENALADLDSPSLEVRVSPGDLKKVAASLDDPRAQAVADPTLAPGEARITGEWCDADLTWKTILDAVRESLDA